MAQYNLPSSPGHHPEYHKLGKRHSLYSVSSCHITQTLPLWDLDSLPTTLANTNGTVGHDYQQNCKDTPLPMSADLNIAPISRCQSLQYSIGSVPGKYDYTIPIKM